jgi:nitrite reductase/ring-hydroxylating ferredoxin subunit
MRFLALDKLINLEDGYRMRFKIDSLELILAKEGNEFFAFGAVCPHQEQSLDDAMIENQTVICPRHNFSFSLQSGAHVEGFCPSLPVYTVHFEGNEVGILLAS